MSNVHSPSVATAYTHISAVAYNYRITGLPSITEHISVTLYMKGLKRRNLNNPIKRAKPMTSEILEDMRRLLDTNPSLVTWRTVWRAHIEFGLLLRFDDIKRYEQLVYQYFHILNNMKNNYRLMVSDVSFEQNASGLFARLQLRGGKTVMQENSKNDRILTAVPQDSCLYALTKRYVLSFI